MLSDAEMFCSTELFVKQDYYVRKELVVHINAELFSRL